MSWIIFSLFCFAVWIPVVFIIGTLMRSIGKKDQSELESIGSIVRWVGTGVIGLIWLFVTIWASVHNVDYGNVGLIQTFGAISSVRTEAGLVIIAPWQNFEQENVQTQSLLTEDSCYDGRFQHCYSTFSIDNNDVFVIGILNFHIDAHNVKTLRVNIGPNYKTKVVLPRINQILKDETVKYKAVDITPNREKIRGAIRDRLTEELARDGIAVEDFLLQNVDFRDEVKASIEKKVIADQDAEAAERQVAVSEAQARQVVATAKGTADANRLINESLTPLLIQFQALQKLAPNVQIAFLPSGQGIIIDPANMLGGMKQTP